MKITPTKYKLKSLITKCQKNPCFQPKALTKARFNRTPRIHKRNIQKFNNTKTKGNTRITKILTNKDIGTELRATMNGIEMSRGGKKKSHLKHNSMQGQ